MATKILYYDLETTGLNYWEHGIHQLSGILEVDGKDVLAFDYKVKPKALCKIEQQALDLQKLTPEIINAYDEMPVIFNTFRNILTEHCDKFNPIDKIFLCGYNNAGFDNQFLRQWFADNGDKFFGSWFWSNSIDVMVLATEYLKKKRAGMGNFKLHSVAIELGIGVDASRLHDALYDIELTREIYKIITAKE